MAKYDELRKTQAEVELQTKLRSVEPLHKSSNAASLKVEAARQEIPEVPSQSPSGQVQEPQKQAPEPEPVPAWKVRYDADERDRQTRKTDYAEAIKTEDFERKEAMDKEMVGRMKEYGYDGRDIEDFKKSVNQYHNAVSNYTQADELLTQRERHKTFSDEERKLEGQHKWEQTQAKMAQLAAQRHGDRPAARSGQAPEQPVRPQEPPRVAVATPDGGRVAQEREAMQRGGGPQRPEPRPAPEAAKAPERSQEPSRAAPTEAAPEAGKRKLTFYEDLHPPTQEHQIKR